MENAAAPLVEIVVPARNEEDCLGRCLESLTGQKGIAFAITVVDDASTDSTRAVAASFPGVRVLTASAPPPGMSGKVNALIEGARGATAKWLLFTDADTFHFPGSLAAAVAEAEAHGADLLSYSPQQETGTWAERALMPLVFGELERVFPTDRVSDPADPAAAANGQYLLVRREVYESLGGHRPVAGEILEDLEMARLYKAMHRKIRFRLGKGLVSARMYRSFPALVAGWTKSLIQLFPHPLWLGARRSLEFLVIVAAVAGAIAGVARRDYAFAIAALAVAAFFYSLFLRRILILRLRFTAAANLLSFFGLPFYVWLLARSWFHVRVRGAVTWKGRTYGHSAPRRPAGSSMPERSGLES